MNRIFTSMMTGILFLLISCNNGNKNDGSDSKDTLATAAVAEPAFTPFKIIMIKHPVKDFEKWREVYLAHDSIRRAYGISQFVLGRGLEDSNIVVVFDKIEDVQKAKDFTSLPALKVTMQDAVVTGPPTFGFFEVIRSDRTPIEQKERVMVMHHVKDFNAWLKVFDSEGKETRAANGMIDRGIGRGIEDPNMIYIFFAITDLAKVKARLASEEMKKTMTDAGVDGPPTIFYYRHPSI